MHKISLWAILIFGLAVASYAIGTIIWIYFVFNNPPGDGYCLFIVSLQKYLFLGARILFVVSFLGGFVDLVLIHNLVCKPNLLYHNTMEDAKIVVGMTAYNDEDAIGLAVEDFNNHPKVSEVIVIDNNSKDGTASIAAQQGATVIHEAQQGYGFACMRALKEAASRGDIIVLVEGDRTFSSSDLNKLLAYLENVDMVLGTRTTRELLEKGSQLDWLMNPANQIMAKLIQLRFWGTRFTDVGCTYRAIRRDAYLKIKDRLCVGGMHFSPHMIIEAMKAELKVIEVPVTFRKRVGASKGVGSNKLRASWVALLMLWLIFFR